MTYRSHDPEAEPDDRDLADMTREERRAILHEMSSLDLIDVIEEAIATVDGLRHEVRQLRRELGRVL
jgi:hypothetical protein